MVISIQVKSTSVVVHFIQILFYFTGTINKDYIFLIILVKIRCFEKSKMSVVIIIILNSVSL